MVLVSPILLLNYLVLLISLMMMGTCQSSFGCYLSFELNLIGSIFLLYWGPRGSINCGVYIYYQVMGSIFFGASCVFLNSSFFWGGNWVEWIIWVGLCVGFIVKIGCFPFHHWVWVVLTSSSWVNIFIFGVFQKCGQFLMVGNMGFEEYPMIFLFFSFITTSFVGSLMGLDKQTVSEFMVCSILFQTGVMGMLSLVSLADFKIYFFFYFFMSVNFFFSLHLASKSRYFSPYKNMVSEPFLGKMVVFGFYGICLMGFPPTKGFFLKSFLVLSLLKAGNVFMSTLMMILSVVSAFWYYQMMKKWMVILKNDLKGFKKLEFVKLKSNLSSWGGMFCYFGMICFDLIMSGK
uniref:NADH-ubiquinone oxidoreductase chain 2 n=1 Tax=Hiatella arctica TaxID=120431 RepID=Q06SB1_9BIVA|nr:NADH dehydrogenase subunit 2 [Hiatella arctica]